jgi:K(+)-stimulated pyrophosphate-energized sodium pump
MIYLKIYRGKDPGDGLNGGTVATTVIFIILSYFGIKMLGFSNPMGIFLPSVAGLLAGVIIGFTSDAFTDSEKHPVKATAGVAKTGPALVILNGFSFGLLSIVPSLLGIVVAMISAWFLAEHFGIEGTYGVSIAAVGMLSITGMVISADAYGPIVDNAKGCAEAGGEDEKTIAVCDKLDSAGNTAKAITKGFAIGAAALTVLALFSAYAESVNLESLDLKNPGVVAGMFLGAMMPPVFSALTILSVGKNAFIMVEEIRRQFRETKGLLEGKVKPDSNRCVDIATRGALRELLAPGLLSFLTPLAIGFLLGPRALGGFLAGAIITGIVFALLMANAGGLWDNAKKFVEDGAFGGKGSESHKATVVGDTVGDPFKDTAGPSINTLITVMSLVSTIFAPLIAKLAIFKL